LVIYRANFTIILGANNISQQSSFIAKCKKVNTEVEERLMAQG